MPFALPFFKIDTFAIVMPIRSDNSVTLILRFASMTSNVTLISIGLHHQFVFRLDLFGDRDQIGERVGGHGDQPAQSHDSQSAQHQNRMQDVEEQRVKAADQSTARCQRAPACRSSADLRRFHGRTNGCGRSACRSARIRPARYTGSRLPWRTAAAAAVLHSASGGRIKSTHEADSECRARKKTSPSDRQNDDEQFKQKRQFFIVHNINLFSCFDYNRKILRINIYLSYYDKLLSNINLFSDSLEVDPLADDKEKSGSFYRIRMG